MNIRSFLTVAYFVLATYAFGGGVVSGIMYYPSWKFVSAEDLPAVHKSVLSRVFIYVPFVFLALLVNILLIWFHHPAMSTSLIVITAALHLFILIVSFTLFLPIHKQLNSELDRAKCVELIDKIVMYDRYLRVIPGCIAMIATIIMLDQVVSISSR
jgi:hypothetical protein